MSGRRRKGLSPSLFPFLAVLVCTLGTLILLLALVAQEAADAAVADAENAAAAKQAAQSIDPPPKPPESSQPQLTQVEAQTLLDEGEFRVEQLVSIREEQTADIERRRDAMTQVEAHMKRIQEELERLKREAQLATGEIEASPTDTHELDSLRRTLAAEAEAITQLKGDSDRQTPRIAIIPHKGPNGTDRRPIYLECTAQGLTVWPEGAKITIGQLEESVEQANPLDAALRVVRYHAMQNYGDVIAPYPLLVVRPDGIETYAAARTAMQDWDDQYGYELVPADTKLAYADPDAQLAVQLNEAIRAAVIKQHGMNALATRAAQSMAGAIAGRREFPRLSAAAMDRSGRASGFSDHREGFGAGSRRTGQYSGYSGGGYGSSGYGSGSYNSSGYGSGTGADAARKLDQQIREATQELQRNGESVASVGELTDNPYHAGDTTQHTGSQQYTGSQSAAGQSPANQSTQATSQQFGDFDGTAAFAKQQGTGSSGHPNRSQSQTNADATASGADKTKTNQYLSPNIPRDNTFSAQSNPYAYAGDTSNESPAGMQLTSPGSQAGNQSSAQAYSQSPSSLNSSQSSSSQSPSNPSGSDGRTGSTHRATTPSNSQQAGQPQQASGSPPPRTAPQNLSATREIAQREGADWALPREIRSSKGNAIVRTIRVECYPNRLVLVAAARGGPTEIFGLADSNMNRASLELASAVRDRIERWGAAIPGGRWQPLLSIDVKPGGEQRFYQLRQLLSGSGVDVEGRRSQ